MEDNLQQLKSPIGPFEMPKTISQHQLDNWIQRIQDLPARLRLKVEGLSDEQLDTQYRPSGWTLRQVVHHLPDSHMNSYIRFKLAVTEKNPTIRPYHEDRWAECLEARTAPIESSLLLLESLHHRWVLFLRSLKAEEFLKTFVHPEHNEILILQNVLALYAWHGEHHLGHITATKRNNNW
jgi:hypothetical protein